MNSDVAQVIMKKLEDHDQLFVEIKNDISDMMSFFRDNVATKDDLADLRTELMGEINGVKGEINGVKSEINGIKVEINGIKVEINGIKGELEEIKQELRSIKAEMREMSNKIESLEVRMTSLEKMTKEDLDVLVKDFIEVRHKVNIMEKVLRAKGIVLAP